MTIAAASGYISLALDAFRNAVADSTQFRSFCNPDTPLTTRAAALLQLPTVVFDLPNDGDESHTRQQMSARRPYGHCWMPDEGLTLTKAAAPSSFFPTSQVVVIRLERDTPDNFSNLGLAQEAERDWSNEVGVIWKETLDNMGGYDFGDTLQSTLVEAPGRAHPEDWPAMGDHQYAALMFTMGGTV